MPLIVEFCQILKPKDSASIDFNEFPLSFVKKIYFPQKTVSAKTNGGYTWLPKTSPVTRTLHSGFLNPVTNSIFNELFPIH